MAKESSASRRARVKFQLRDRKGRWIEMGRGVKWYSPRLGREVSGTVVGTKGRNAVVDITSEPKGRDGKSQQVSVKGSDIEVINNKATIGKSTAPAVKPDSDAATEKAKLGLERRQKAVAAPAETDEEDAVDPDIADLEDEDLDLGDLEDDEPVEADEESAEETGPTSVEDIEATIEELEAVVEEVASGDLDEVEVEAKLSEEVYELVGNDGKSYDLDVKKSNGKWNYRLKDEDGETRAMIPADENDSVDAGAKLNAAINPKTKAKAKAETTAPAAPKEEAPAAPERDKAQGLAIGERFVPGTEEEGRAVELYRGGQNWNDKLRSGDNLTPEERSHVDNLTGMIEKQKPLPTGTTLYRGASGDKSNTKDLKVGDTFEDKAFMSTTLRRDEAENFGDTIFEIDASGETGLAMDAYRQNKNQQGFPEDIREPLDASLREGEVLLPPNTGLRVTGVDKDDSGRTVLKAEIFRTEAQQDRDARQTEDSARYEGMDDETGAVKASKDAADVLRARLEMHSDEDHGMEVDDEGNVTVTDPAKAEFIFNAASGDTVRVTNRPGESRSDSGQETRDELKDLREKLGVPDTREQSRKDIQDAEKDARAPKGEVFEGLSSAALGALARRSNLETVKAPKDREDIGFNVDREGVLRITDRDKAIETITGMRDAVANNTYSRNSARDAEVLSQALDKLSGNVEEKAPEAAPEVPEAAEAPTTPETAPEAPESAPEAAEPSSEFDGEAALAAVGVQRTEPVALPGEKFPPTRQQQDVIDAVVAGKDTVVQAKAGAGKTTTLQAIATRIPDKKVVYVAFNKSVQTEAEGRMPGNVEPRTGHSISFNWVGKDVQARFKGENGIKQLKLDEDIAKHVGITGSYKGDPGSDQDMLYPEDIASAAMKAVDKFAFNAEDDISEDHFPDSMDGTSPEAKAAVLDAANKIWADINAPDGRVQLTQDHMRKMWALSRPDLTKAGSGLRRAAEVLFIDEAQDTPPVLAKVVSDQKMQKVIVGDADQAIYGFSGATDYLSKAEKDIELPLNRSWRFGPEVADAGNRYLQLLGSKGRVVGGGPASNVRLDGGTMTDADAVLVRTNSGALGEIMEETNRGRIVGVEKKTRDKFNQLADTMDWLMSKDKGRTPIARPDKVLPELSHYKNWEHVVKEAERGDNVGLSTFVNLQSTHGSDGIRKAMANVVAVDGKPAGGSKGVGGNLGGVSMDDTGSVTVANGKAYQNKDDLKSAGFKFLPDPSGDLIRSGANKGQPRKSWQAVGTPEQRAEAVKRFADRIGSSAPEGGGEPVKPDVVITTAHKAKGLEWGKVRIGNDFRQPKLDPNSEKVTFPEPEELRLAYVAVTRAETDLDPGSLKWVYEHTSENGGTPEPEDKPAAQDEVTEPPVSAADDSDYVEYVEEELGSAADTVVEDTPEATPEAPEASPEAEEVPEATPAPAEAVEPAETPVEPAPAEATPVDDAAPVDELNEDGLTPAEAAYADKLERAISDGYRTGIGNVKALEERLNEIYDRGTARQRGEDPDAAPEPAPAVQPVAETEPEAPATGTAPVETETEVAEEPTEDGPQGDVSEGEEEIEGGPTDLESFEATASELFETFQSVQTTPRTPEELEELLEAEIYLLRGEDGNGYEFGLDVDADGKWSYVLADEEGNELERYDVMAASPEDAGRKAFERVNGSVAEPEAPEEAPVDPADATPEAEEEVVDDADRVEPEEIPEVSPEVPEPAPMPEVEEAPEAPEAQTPEETPETAPEEAPTGGTAAPEPDSRPVHPVKLKAANYPDGTQIKSGRSGEVIEKTDGKWHVAGSPAKAADPMNIDTPVVSEMPMQDAESFDAFDGSLESLEPGDIIRTANGAQAAVVGVRNGKAMVIAHGIPDAQKALRPDLVAVDPAKIAGVQKFNAGNAPAEQATPEAPATPRATRTRSAGGTPIKDVNGYETKIGDRVMTAVGQGEVIALRPASGPNGSVFVRLDDGKEKSFRSNKFTNAAGVDTLEGDDPATMEIGAEGTGADGRKFLVGKGNKPIHKGDRVQLADGRIGTVSGIYAGVKSANIKMEDGSVPRKKVSTLDAIDYEAPEKGPDAPEDGPEDNGGGDGGSSPDTPQSGPDSGTGAASNVEFVFGDNETSYAIQDVFEGVNSSPERLAEATAFFEGPDKFMASVWQDGAHLATLMRGEGTPKELARAARDFNTFLFGGALMEKFHESGNKSFRMQDMLDMWTPHAEQLQGRYSSSLGKLSEAVGQREDLDSPELASYDGAADFSSFDWSTSKFNPSSEKAQSIGDLEDDMSNVEGVRRGSRVRNKRTGEYGFLSSVQIEKALGDEDITDSEVSVLPSAVSATLTKEDRTFKVEAWSVEDIEPSADVTWAREPLDFSDAAGLDDLANRAQEAYPGLYVALEGITLERGISVMNSMSKLVSKYPMLQSGLQSISTGDAGGAMAYASHLKRAHPSGEYGPSRMVIDNIKSDRHMLTATWSSSETGWFAPVKEGDEVAHTIYHETAHILDTISGGITEEDVVEILKSAYPDFEFGSVKNLRTLLSRAKIAKYAAHGDKLDVGELVAEAFADAELNATDAWPLSKLIHRYLLERLQEG